MTKAQALRANDSVPHKVMLRMDRRLSRHGVRSYRGYSAKGQLGAWLKFDDQTIEITPFGQLRRAS